MFLVPPKRKEPRKEKEKIRKNFSLIDESSRRLYKKGMPVFFRAAIDPEEKRRSNGKGTAVEQIIAAQFRQYPKAFGTKKKIEGAEYIGSVHKTHWHIDRRKRKREYRRWFIS